MLHHNPAYAIYGFGRAGRSLSKSLALIPNSQIIAFSRSADVTAKEFAKNAGVSLVDSEREFFDSVAGSQAVVLFVAVSDDAVAHVASRLMNERLPGLVAHLSGVLPAMELNVLNEKGATAQFHPLASLDGVQGIPAGCLVGIQCDNEDAREKLMQLARKLQCHPAMLKEGDQNLYHAAAVLTGNLSLGLVSMSCQLLKQCGVEKRQAEIALAQLLKSTALALERNELGHALTGPLARGDVQTIAKHVEALKGPSVPREIAKVYAELSNELLDRVGVADLANEEIRNKLRSLAGALDESLHVWKIRLDTCNFDEAKFYANLSESERSKALSMTHSDVRRRYVVSHYALRNILAKYTLERPATISIDTLASGKPFIADARFRHIKFSLTHSDEVALVAVARDEDVGIDVEKIREIRHFDDFVTRFLSDTESGNLLATPSELKVKSFFQIWTAKEAYLKARGLGLRGELRNFDVVLHDDALQLRLPPLEKGAGGIHGPAQQWSICPVDLDQNYIGSVAICRSNTSISCFDWSEHA